MSQDICGAFVIALAVLMRQYVSVDICLSDKETT